MATETRGSTAVSEYGLGQSSWSSVANAIVENGSGATITAEMSNGLLFTDFDFSDIGDSDTITNISVRVKVLAGGSSSYLAATLHYAGGLQGNEYSAGVSSYPEWVVFSASPGDWGAGSLTPLLLKSVGFGCMVYCLDYVGASLFEVDHCETIITYTPSGGGGSGQPIVIRSKGVPGMRLGGPTFGRGW